MWKQIPWIPEAPKNGKSGPLVPRRQGLVTTPAAQPRFGIVICQTFSDNDNGYRHPATSDSQR